MLDSIARDCSHQNSHNHVIGTYFPHTIDMEVGCLLSVRVCLNLLGTAHTVIASNYFELEWGDSSVVLRTLEGLHCT